MKKFFTTTTYALLIFGICLHAQQYEWHKPNAPSLYGYDGPPDEIFWAKMSDVSYGLAVIDTTLGLLARYSDIIGVGQVSQRSNEQFTVTIDHALVGCTNGATIEVHAVFDWGGGEYDASWMDAYLPTNQSQIIFAARTNNYDSIPWQLYWNHPEVPIKPDDIYEHVSISYLNRSWWHVDRDDGLILTQFTNVLQAVRFERNWTNYIYLCRDGANSLSNRVREDSFRDLRHLCGQATPEQAQFILEDPLVDQKHKDWMLQKPNP